jgi:hypothetical protein
MNLKHKNCIVRSNFWSILLFANFLFGCANQLPPGGGPQDITPPEIISAFPANGTVNFKENYFELEFSEYVDKRSVQDAIFISPAINGSLEFDWSGKSVTVYFPEKLKDSLTYIITLGTNAVDLNNKNKIAQAYSFAFSTGEKIDRGIIEGKVYNDKPQGIMMYAFPIGDSIINPTKHKPKYISQAGSNGDYKLLGLAFGKYRVFAVQDKYSDLIYNVGDDSYGCPYADVSITELDSVFHSLNFMMTKEDTLKPRLLNATMTDRYHILLEFSEPIDSSDIKTKNFSVVDSTTIRNYSPVFSFRGKSKRENVVLVVKDSLSEQNNNYIQSMNIKDMLGNIALLDNVQLIVSNKPDTSAPNLYFSKSIPKLSDDKLSHEFEFYFDDGFDSTLAKKGINVSERKGKVITSQVTFIDDATFKVRMLEELKPKGNYQVKIDLNNLIDAAGNKRDSVYKYGFIPTSPTDFSAVSGLVKLPESLQKEKVMLVLESSEGERIKYQKKTNLKQEWKFNKVNSGKYILWSYIDMDSSESFNFGKPFPFIPSERFVFYPDTLKLRARWPVEDVVIEYK